MNGYALFFYLMSVSMIRAVDPMIIAHRGASGYEVENTLKAFERAYHMGAAMIECDVHECASGDIVVLHDDTIDRTTNGSGYVETLTLDELHRFKTKDDQTIPTLQKVLDLVDRRMQVNIELKGANTADAVAAVVREYVQLGWQEADFLITSFNFEQVEQFHRQLPTVPIGYIIEKIPLDYQQLFAHLKPNVVVVYYTSLDKVFIDAMHSYNVMVFAYTVNNQDDNTHMKNIGVDGIITNHPDRV